MAENKLEGFEDFDNLLGDAQAESAEGGGAGDFAGELDDLLGGDAGSDDSMADAGQSDSELDSFFEDLSTIDDLEVLQEDEPEPTQAADDASVPEPDLDEDDEVPMAAPAAAAPEPRRAKPAREPKAKTSPGFIRRWFKRLVLLGILGAVGFFLYNFFFPEGQTPWTALEQEKDKLISMVEERMKSPPKDEPPRPPPGPPPAAMQPPAQPKPEPRPQAKPKPRPPARVVERGPWSIQVATCFFPSCLESYRSYLQAHGRSVIVRDKMTRTESLEIYSISSWRERDEAQGYAERINREIPLEGHAFVYSEDGAYRVSMGAFTDLARANVVKDALSQQYRGQVSFATRVKSFPYKLQTVMTGRFPSRGAAQAALEKLKDQEPRLKDAFVARNR